MARNLAPIVKLSRREGVALHPKAHKVMVRRKNPPGWSANKRPSKPTQFGIQLREKQKVKRLYGLLERPFRRLIQEAERASGVSGEVLLELLERRLDNVVYRAHLAPSRQAARQLVNHGHFRVNDRRANIPSLRVKPGDLVTVRPASAKNSYFSQLKEQADAKAETPKWLSVDVKKLQIKITGNPQRAEAEPEINESLIIEYYSR